MGLIRFLQTWKLSDLFGSSAHSRSGKTLIKFHRDGEVEPSEGVTHRQIPR